VFLFYRYLLRKKRQMMQNELLEAKEMFFTNITHEFRTPLTVIQAAAQDILTSSSTTGNSDSEEEAKKSHELCENAQDIIRNGESLLSLINEILEVARLSSGKTFSSPAMQHADIVAYITMTCQSFKPLAEAKGIALNYSPSCEGYEMDFSTDYMKKILQNLISNAVKYSESGGRVELSSRVSGDNFVLTVADQGIGMDEKAAEKAFLPFFRVSDSKEVGTGVGLSIVKLSVEALGGTISLDTAPGKGSRFTILLPVTHNAEPEAINELNTADVGVGSEEVEESGDGAKILIVEDTPEVAKYIQKQLSHDNYAFYFAKNGEEGLRQALEVQPDIIITDVMMPVCDGYELCRKVRENEMLCHIPIIMVTAKITHEDRVRGLEAGADAYLEKPFHEDELRVRVGKLIEHNRRLRELFSQAIECDAAPKAKEVNAADNEFLVRVTEKFQANMAEGKIDYDAFASDLCITRVQLNRKIKAITGYTTTEYLLLLRLQHAKELLKTTDLPIVEVALECGVDNISYFGSLFKKHVGVTPMQYRGKFSVGHETGNGGSY
ncbi:MAG: response regulator, partial [Muribaculaceae bacterium]